jgi:hypothetical protein
MSARKAAPTIAAIVRAVGKKVRDLIIKGAG